MTFKLIVLAFFFCGKCANQEVIRDHQEGAPTFNEVTGTLNVTVGLLAAWYLASAATVGHRAVPRAGCG